MTPLEQGQIAMLRSSWGDMTAEEALECALRAEQLKRECSKYDPVSGRMALQQRTMELYALLIEKEKNA